MSNLYSLTITLKPKLYSFNVEQQYDLAKPIITNLNLGKMTCVAELTKLYNIHFHLLIERDTSMQCIGLKGRPISFPHFVANKFRNSEIIGFHQLKTIKDKQGWIDYMGKDIAKTKEDVGRRIVLVDEFQIYSWYE